jgi:hypothetical protein
MPIPTSITSGSNALWQQSASQQAKRSADQATQTAQSLQAQARDARAVADRAQDDARALEMKAGQAQTAAAQASLSVQNSSSFLTMQASSGDVYNVVPKAVSLASQIPAQIQTGSPGTSATTQIVGSFINTTA